MATGLILGLNRTSPAAGMADLGGKLDALITLINEMRTDINVMNNAFDGLLAKLDADGGVTDTNYAALWGTSGSESNHWPVDLSASAVDTF